MRRPLADDDLVRAPAHASREADPLLANVLATEALHRIRRSRVASQSIGEGVIGFDERARIDDANPAARFILAIGAAWFSWRGVRCHGRPRDWWVARRSHMSS